MANEHLVAGLPANSDFPRNLALNVVTEPHMVTSTAESRSPIDWRVRFADGGPSEHLVAAWGTRPASVKEQRRYDRVPRSIDTYRERFSVDGSDPPARRSAFGGGAPEQQTHRYPGIRGNCIGWAPNLYIVGATLAPEQAVAHHRTAIISVFWPGAVLSDRTALAGGMPFKGWIFITHPDPVRRSDLELPGITASPRVGPGQLPGDTPMPDGLHISGPARRLVENVSIAGRPPRGRPSRQAGTETVEDEIDQVARHGGAGAIGNVLSQLEARCAIVRRAVRRASSVDVPRPRRTARRHGA